MTANRFRALIGIHLVLSAASVGLHVALAFAPVSYSAALHQAYEAEPTGLLGASASLFVDFALFAGWVLGLIGMYRFRRWGRGLSAVVTVAMLAYYAISGPFLAGGIELAVTIAAEIAWGAVLAIAYCVPAIKARFEAAEPSHQS